MNEGTEKVLYESHPAMFRNHPLYFILCIILSVVGVGLVMLLVWWLQTLATNLIVTDEKTVLRKGLLSKYTTEVFHDNVRNVQVSQTFLQRIFDVGYLGISSAGQAGLEIEINGIPHPDTIKQLITEHRNDDRTD
jgi:uncharacterized membrane protein YdbT with pleckstrin-like domain